MRSIFGWSLPPGCSMRDIDRAFGEDETCDVCCKHVDECICPECPHCQSHGDWRCYAESGGGHPTPHPTTFNVNDAQLAGQAAFWAAMQKANDEDQEYCRQLEAEQFAYQRYLAASQGE